MFYFYVFNICYTLKEEHLKKKKGMNNIEVDFFLFKWAFKQILWIATKLVLYFEIKLRLKYSSII